MAKRLADTELNHDNWNLDDEASDDVGPFKRASKEELSRRQIKVARRRSGITTGEDSGPSIFKNFTGFGSVGSSTFKTPLFDFGSKTGGDLKEKGSMFEATSFKLTTFGNDAGKTSVGSTDFGISGSKKSPEKTKTNGVSDTSTKEKPTDDISDGNNRAYLSKLRALNEGVLKWIQKHLSNNININLNPVFDDYRKHFDELQLKYQPKFAKSATVTDLKTTRETTKSSNTDLSKSNSVKESAASGSNNVNKSIEKTASSSDAMGKAASGSNIPVFSFGSKDSILKNSSAFSFCASESVQKDSATFSFGSTDSKPKDGTSLFGSTSSMPKEKGDFTLGSSSTGFSFKSSDASSSSKGFSFGSGPSSLSFGSGTSAAAPSTLNQSDDEADSSPKEEIVEVKEDDAIYEQKCKLFYKKDNSFVDKGAGTLFLKPVADTKKVQLVIRAATNLGNVLLNIVINSSQPTQRLGKNNVLIICVPNPPIDPKAESSAPVSMLIRVKTAEDADKLLAKIDESKGE